MISVIDYGVGNLPSVAKSIERAGAKTQLISTADEILSAEKLVLPGVGAYGACMRNLCTDIQSAVLEKITQGTPTLGICVGMQILSTQGLEFGTHKGLNIIAGTVRKIQTDFKIPHMGWNTLNVESPHPVLNHINGEDVYFVHSFVFDVDDKTHRLASCNYGENFTAVVGKDTLIATQFHPEKSQGVGIRLLSNFVNWRP